MNISVKIFFRQMLRSKVRLLLNVALIAAATAFFVMSINLYQNSRNNLQAVDGSYTTLGMMAFYGDVDRYGNLVSPNSADYMGNHLLSVNDFDLSQITNREEVLDYDLRFRCAAYIPGTLAITLNENYSPNAPEYKYDIRSGRQIIRFTLKGDQPVYIPFTQTGREDHDYLYRKIKINIIDQAVDQVAYLTDYIELGFTAGWNDTYANNYAEEIKRLNRSEDTSGVTLYPGVEYIMGVSVGDNRFRRDDATGVYDLSNHHLFGDQYKIWTTMTALRNYYDQVYRVMYSKVDMYAGGALMDPNKIQPFYIQRYEDVQANPEEAAHWKKLEDCVKYSLSSFSTVFTDDITSAPAWYYGGMYLNDGRLITAEEYASGAKVCMISGKLASLHGWKVGDKLDLNFYQYNGYFDNVETGGQMEALGLPMYSLSHDGFFDQGEYEIVGIYGQQAVPSMTDETNALFYQPWDAIYLPTNSVANAPAKEDWPIQPSLFSLTLKNGSIDSFQNAMEELGYTDKTEGEYTLRMTFDDQGYGSVGSGLQKMGSTAKLLMILSGIVLAVTLLLTAFFFAQQHKQNVGILRMLGGKKGQAFAGILICALVVALTGAIIGSLSGGAIGESVAEKIMKDSAAQLAADRELSDYIMLTSKMVEVEISIGTDLAIAAVSGAGVLLLFMLLTAFFVALYIGKKTRDLLPRDQA